MQTPVSAWLDAGANPDMDPTVWDAIDAVAASRGNVLSQLGACGWSAARVMKDPRIQGGEPNPSARVWRTLLAWGFNGECVAQGLTSWFNPAILVSMRVGLLTLKEEASLRIEDVVAGSVSASTLAQLGSVHGWLSPVPYLVVRMGMTPEQFAGMGYTAEEWGVLLAVDRRMITEFGLLADAAVRKLLRKNVGWTARDVSANLDYTREEAVEMFPRRRNRGNHATLTPKGAEGAEWGNTAAYAAFIDTTVPSCAFTDDG